MYAGGGECAEVRVSPAAGVEEQGHRVAADLHRRRAETLRLAAQTRCTLYVTVGYAFYY